MLLLRIRARAGGGRGGGAAAAAVPARLGVEPNKAEQKMPLPINGRECKHRSGIPGVHVEQNMITCINVSFATRNNRALACVTHG